MLRLAIVDSEGKILAAKDIATAFELQALADQARNVIRDCERLAQQLKVKSGAPGTGTVPYLT
jgi:hypothetical protein